MSEAIVYLPLRALRESPTNPRRFYSDGGLKELADSIATQGVMSPIIARPLDQADVEQTHEIVFGHRRYRAAGLAGLDEVPVLVRAMSDAEAAVAQIHENLHRADVHAVEEADAFRALMQDHGMPVEQIVADSGKSRSYVYGRLKLANLSLKVRAACIEEGLGGEIALLIARLPHHKLQDEALKTLRGMSAGDQWPSYRSAKALLQRYTVSLTEDARWDLADTTMPGGACAQCPKMACNDAELADLPADVCVDRQCFDTKANEHGRRVVALAREAGRTVIDGEQARQMMPSGYWIDGADRVDSHALERLNAETGKRENLTWREALELLPKEHRERLLPIVIAHPDRPDQPVEALTDEAQAEVLRLLGDTDDNNSDRSSHTASFPVQSGGRGDPFADWTATERAVAQPEAWRKIVGEIVRRLRGLPRTTEELRLVLAGEIREHDDLGVAGEVLGLTEECERAAETAGGEFDVEAWYSHRLAQVSADDLGVIVVALAIERLHDGYLYSDDRDRAARRAELAAAYGVDVLPLAGQHQSDDTGCAGEDQKDEAAAGGPVMSDLFSTAGENA